MAHEKGKSKELIRAGPDAALAPFEEVERWFDQVFRHPFVRPPLWPGVRYREPEGIHPSVDIFEDDDDVVVEVELPGIKKEDVKVTVSEDVLTVSGEKARGKEAEERNYHRSERACGVFIRTLRLPHETETSKATAKFEDGILEIRLPKTEESKKKEKEIAIE